MIPGKVWLVGAGPGDPDLITVRGREVLQQAEVVLHDALAHAALLELCPRAQIVNVGKRFGRPSAEQGEIVRVMIEHARKGQRVVRLKGGDPFLFARGAEEALALKDAAIEFEIVPGISSPVGTAAFAGFPLTHRDFSSSVTFITGSDRAGKHWSPTDWAKLAASNDTLCVLMGMRRIAEICAALIEGGKAAATPAAVVQWGARPEQRVVQAPLVELAAAASRAGLANPAVIVVGQVVTLRDSLNWYDSRPLFGKRLLVPRPRHQATQTARAIRLRGASPVIQPAIEIHPPPDRERLRQALDELQAYDWVVFTSTNGVERCFAELDASGRDARAFARSKIAAIGPKTAAALRHHGIIADLVAEQYVGEALAEAMIATGRLGRVMLLRALEARELLPASLREAGAAVDVVAAYRTQLVSGTARDALRSAVVDGRLDGVLLTSSSMVNSLLDALGPDARAALEGTVVASIGPVTTKTAADRGLPVDVTADTYTVDGLLDALEQYWQPSPPTVEA